MGLFWLNIRILTFDIVKIVFKIVFDISFNKLFPNNKFGTILIYKRAPVVQIEGVVQAESGGSSGSHYDFACIPEWLMEPFCGGALTEQPFPSDSVKTALAAAPALAAASSESVKTFADPNNKESIRNLTNRIIQEKRIRLLVVEYFGLKGFKQDVDEFISKTKPTEVGLRVLIDKILLSRI